MLYNNQNYYSYVYVHIHIFINKFNICCICVKVKVKWYLRECDWINFMWGESTIDSVFSVKMDVCTLHIIMYERIEAELIEWMNECTCIHMYEWLIDWLILKSIRYFKLSIETAQINGSMHCTHTPLYSTTENQRLPCIVCIIILHRICT